MSKGNSFVWKRFALVAREAGWDTTSPYYTDETRSKVTVGLTRMTYTNIYGYGIEQINTETGGVGMIAQGLSYREMLAFLDGVLYGVQR